LKSSRDNNGMAQKNFQRQTAPAPKLDRGTQLGRARRLCLSIPGTIEKISLGEPIFFTPKPPHVGVRGWVGVGLSKVDDEQSGALMREAFQLVKPKRH
jgi:hypothetical protein